MDQSKVTKFTAVRDFLLEQFRLTPADYRKRFNEMTRKSDISNVLFANRLYTILQFYVNARKANTVDKLMSCVTADRIRSSLTDYNCTRHIASLESTCVNGWLDHIEMSRAIDAYYANLPHGNRRNTTGDPGQARNESQTAGVNAAHVVDSTRQGASQVTQANQTKGNRQSQKNASSLPQQPQAASNVTRTQPSFCFVCGSNLHYASACPQRYDRAQGTAKTESNARNTQKNSQHKTSRIFTCRGNSSQPASLQSTEPIVVMSDTYTDTAQSVNQSATHTPQQCSTQNSEFETDMIVKEPFSLSHVATTPIVGGDDLNVVSDYSLNKALINPDYCPLRYVSVCIENVPNCLNGMIDSGAETAVAHTSLFPDALPPSMGKITLRGIYGKPIVAELVSLNIRLASNPSTPYIPMYCAVSSEVNEPLILTTDIIRRLSDSQFTLSDSQPSNTEPDDNSGKETDMTDKLLLEDDACVFANLQHNSDNLRSNTFVTSDTGNADDSASPGTDTQDIPLFDHSDCDKFKTEQKDDESLSHCWRLARTNKGGYFVDKDLLYHQDNIAGQIVQQLVVPKV
jgi:hypothetical protein